MQDLSSPPGMEPMPLAVKARNLNHWTTREVQIKRHWRGLKAEPGNSKMSVSVIIIIIFVVVDFIIFRNMVSSLKTDISVSSMASKKCLAQNKEYWGKMTDKLPWNRYIWKCYEEVSALSSPPSAVKWSSLPQRWGVSSWPLPGPVCQQLLPLTYKKHNWEICHSAALLSEPAYPRRIHFHKEHHLWICHHGNYIYHSHCTS